MATVSACTAFGAVCGSSPATAATMATVGLPEMKRYKYADELSTGSVASGGGLGMIMPPSVVLIVYGILTEESIGKLFVAGIIPALLITLLFIVAIYLRCRVAPDQGPPGLFLSPDHAAWVADGTLQPQMVSWATQVIRLAPGVDRRQLGDDVRALADMTEVYRSLRAAYPEAILWQYTSLQSGVHFAYPGKGGTWFVRNLPGNTCGRPLSRPKKPYTYYCKNNLFCVVLPT